MNTTFWRRCARLWCQGLLLFTLRFAQLRTGFDPDTGLMVPCVPGTALLILLALFAAAEIFWCLRTPKEQAVFSRYFTPPGDNAAVAAILGGMLLAAGGLLMLLTSIPAREIAGGVTGLLSLASGAGMVALVRQARSGSAPGAGPVLPAMFLGVFLVLEVYLPSSSDPVLARFYIPLLAAAGIASAFSQLGGILRGEGSVRAFVLWGDTAVILCLTALADGGLERTVIFGGAALLLTVFLYLRRTEPLPPAEAPAEEA